MTIARAQMYRQLYQLGGIGTLPMDYGQPLQIPQQQQPMFTTTGSATSSPILNYGQTGLGQAGGTPLSRPGYQEGGLSDFYKGEEPIIPRIENIGGLLDQAEKSIGEPQNNFTSPLATTFSRFGMQEGGMGIMGAMPQDQAMASQAPQMDPEQAIEIIIQMLIEQGVPPEEARQIALQMIQAVAEGGMQEMSDERVEARFGGSMRNGREQYGLGSIFKGAAKAVSGVVKGVTNAVKSVAKSDIGKLALTVAAAYFAPYAFGATTGGLTGYAQAFPGLAGPIGSTQSFLFGTPGLDMIAGAEGITTKGLFGLGGNFAPLSGTIASSLMSPSGIIKSLGGNAITGFIGGMFAGSQKPPEYDPNLSPAQNKAKVDAWNAQLNPLINPTVQYPNNPFYPQTQMAADGGRIGYQEGGIGDLISQATKEGFFGTPMMAMGGRMGYAMGAEVPTRENQAGVQELDYRETGGFVPPIGIKEKADDIPAMLSNNEFVFTADAVRNAGGGDVDKGAERMYSLMKNLENGGRV